MLPGNDVPQRTVHFTGAVRLRAQAPEAAPAQPAVKPGDDSVLVSHDDVYRFYFHGPTYQVVAEGWGVDGGAAARFADDLPPNHVPENLPTRNAPRLFELCFQTAGLWEAGRNGRLGLPAHVARAIVDGPVTGGRRPFVAVARPGDDGYDCTVLDEDGQVLARLEGYRTVALPGELDSAVRGPLEAAIGGDLGE